MPQPSSARDRRNRLARLLSEHEGKVRSSELPLFGLATSTAPVPRILGDVDDRDGRVDSIALCFGDPLRADGPLVQVHSTRPGKEPSLSSLLVRELRDRDAGEAAVAAAATAELVDARLVIDEVTRPAVWVRGGTFWAARSQHAGVVVSVVARAWELSWTRLVNVVDIEPFLADRRRYLEALGEGRIPVSATDSGPMDFANGPRALVNMVLELHADWERRWSEHADTGAAGWWAQRPALPREWNRRWEAATQAQMRLAEQAREAAIDELWSMLNQLTRLHDWAPWFGDRTLREAAVSETLMYYSGLNRDVPSRMAQELWRRAWQASVEGRPPTALEALEGIAPLVSTARARQHVAEAARAERACLAAWEDWARARGWRG